MTFAEAAEAYAMLQSGLSYRKVAAVIGISRTHLKDVIDDCLEHGKAASVLLGRRGIPVYAEALMLEALRLRATGQHWKVIARRLAVEGDPEKFRRACCWYNLQMAKSRSPKRR